MPTASQGRFQPPCVGRSDGRREVLAAAARMPLDVHTRRVRLVRTGSPLAMKPPEILPSATGLKCLTGGGPRLKSCRLKFWVRDPTCSSAHGWGVGRPAGKCFCPLGYGRALPAIESPFETGFPRRRLVAWQSVRASTGGRRRRLRRSGPQVVDWGDAETFGLSSGDRPVVHGQAACCDPGARRCRRRDRATPPPLPLDP